ncbi:MAG: DNA glycosylase AlkZ-like family protein, partial [Nocardioidaceae bacterium]
MTADLSRAQARRIALVAQGFRDPRHTVPTMRTFNRTLARTAVLQIDSVNVLQRAHYMPLYSRMGPYDVDLLRRASERRPRRIVEYWAHVAAFMPVDLWPVMRHRMRGYKERGHEWAGMKHNPELVASLLKEVAPTARIIMLTVSDEEADLYDAVKNGASGYLLKDSSIDEVAQAIRVV